MICASPTKMVSHLRVIFSVLGLCVLCWAAAAVGSLSYLKKAVLPPREKCSPENYHRGHASQLRAQCSLIGDSVCF
jgi:hypothetical protein